MNYCPHLGTATDSFEYTLSCQDCLPMGGEWVHLRACLTCGHVACCDQSPNRHMTAHFRESGHPVTRSLERGEAWTWCYVDQVTYDPDEVDLEGADLG